MKILYPLISFKLRHMPVYFKRNFLGWNDVGFRNPDIISPNIDYLAKNGMILNQSYVQPVCTPYVYSIISHFKSCVVFQQTRYHNIIRVFSELTEWNETKHCHTIGHCNVISRNPTWRRLNTKTIHMV